MVINLSIKRSTVITLVFVFIALRIFADNYYWIGGSGNWSDINHWATASGGTVLHITPPSANDDVFFDENSFNSPGQSVNVNTENAVCRTLNWSAVTNSPAFENSTSVNIKIFGSFILSPSMLWNYDGTLTFESNQAGNILLTEAQVILNNIIFDGISGEWALSDDLYIAGSIFLNNGRFHTNNKIIECQGFHSSTNNPRELVLGNSHLFNEGSWSLNSTNLIFDAGTSILFIKNGMVNSGDITLTYNKVIFTGESSSLNNQNLYSLFDSITFEGHGLMNGNCSVGNLEIFGDGVIYGADTIVHAILYSDGLLIGSHTITGLTIHEHATIQGNNHITSAYIGGKGIIRESNQIEDIFIRDTSFIYDNNSFGHLFMNRMGYLFDNNYAQYAYFNCDGRFEGSHLFDTLYMTPGFEYIIEDSTIQTINYFLSVEGTCNAPIFIKSSENGSLATINSPFNPVTGMHLSLRDIHANGITPFLAIQSVDLGNNVNWEIDTMTIRDLYWVNGQGNWNDSFHWDVTSGGNGGHCPPTERDNVFIDNNSVMSGDIIGINSRNAVCNNMDWTGSNNPVFSGPDTNNLKIYGSLKFTNDMNLTFFGETHFEDTLSNKTVYSAGQVFQNNVRFQGKSGGWILLDKFNCADTIYHTCGSISTNGSPLICNRYSSAGTGHRSLLLNNDTIRLYGESFTWELNGTNFDLHAGSSVIETFADFSEIISTNAERLVYNNIYQKGIFSRLTNEAYCVYNLVTHLGHESLIMGDCTIDTSIMFGNSSKIVGNDTIKTVIYHGLDSYLEGNNVVEIAYFFDDGAIYGSNAIDTALFFNFGYIVGDNQIDTTIIFGNATIEGNNLIRTATLLNNATFLGDNIFDDLSFTHSKKYLFGHDAIQTINHNWKASGRCTGSIFLMSDEDGKQAIINKTNGNVEIEYAIIRDVKAGGQTPFIATSSIDLGNNEHWEITMAEPMALYWVGGTGKWSDSLHWAPVSGGEGPYCVPTPIDDVYFDENSFLLVNDTVFLDLENATCQNMNWTGSELFLPVFSGNTENSLYIYGSLTFHDAVNLDYEGITYFESCETDQTIKSSGTVFNNSTIFQGRTGGWVFIDDFSTKEDIILTCGSINTNDHVVSCRNFLSPDSNLREILLNDSKWIVNNKWILNAHKLNFEGGSSTIHAGYLFNTFNGGIIVYNDVTMNISDPSFNSTISNDSVYCRFNKVHFFSPNNGIIRGDCSIDSAFFENPSGFIYDNDSINFVWFKNEGTLAGGGHQVKSVIFEGPGYITGFCTVNSAIFNASGFISGNNIIDTTIIKGNGNIIEDNHFNHDVKIYGNGLIQGSNQFVNSVFLYNQGALIGNNVINKDLVIHGHASIFGNNLVNDALLLGWGDLGGANQFDTLTLSPGKTYTLGSGNIQTINHKFNIRGNNCFPIILKSNTNGSYASIFMSSDTVSGDFINMKDINAFGGGVFYAGGHSTNISNNSGWIWEDAPGYIYGLGFESVFLCEGDTLVLSTENFNGNPNTIYLWSDGTIGPTLAITEPGTYEVLVIYSENCEVPGQVVVEQLPAPEINLGSDREICEGLEIDFIDSGNYTEYLWNTGGTDPLISVYETGSYWLEVTGDNGCKNRDTVFLQVIALPVVDLGPDQKIHNDEFVVLDAGANADSYFWSTGETTQTIIAYGVEGGTEYWVIVEYKGCSNADTVTIDEYPVCFAELPTAFSPNGDFINDVLEIFVSGVIILDFKIFNRYGQLVFESSDHTGNESWDGTHYTFGQEMEVFTFYLKAICEDGFMIQKTGNITLLR
ncbi:MAG: gliding motility-associated C-terminal domain-containing protein [Bacteroidales bacterium]